MEWVIATCCFFIIAVRCDSRICRCQLCAFFSFLFVSFLFLSFSFPFLSFFYLFFLKKHHLVATCNSISYFQVGFCLIFNRAYTAKPFMWKWLFHLNFNSNQTHFHLKVLPDHILRQKQKSESCSCLSLLSLCCFFQGKKLRSSSNRRVYMQRDTNSPKWRKK